MLAGQCSSPRPFGIRAAVAASLIRPTSKGRERRTQQTGGDEHQAGRQSLLALAGHEMGCPERPGKHEGEGQPARHEQGDGHPADWGDQPCLRAEPHQEVTPAS